MEAEQATTASDEQRVVNFWRQKLLFLILKAV